MPNTPPIWVISLGRAHNRREFVTAAFAALNVDIELIDAVDGRDLTHQDLKSYSDWRALFEFGHGLTPGVLGCALSHLHVCRRMLDDGLDVVAVFEDDVQPTPSLLDVLSAVSDLPPDWQVVTLHSLFASSQPTVVSDRPITRGRQICRYERTPFGAQAYLINRAGAERVLSVAYPVRLPSDELLYRKRPAGLVVYGIEPTVVLHGAFESEIHRTSEPIMRSGPLVKPLQFGVRAAGALRRRALLRFAGRV